MKKLFTIIALPVCCFILYSVFFILYSLPLSASARDASQITDWYLKDFQSDITVNKDASLDIRETIVADCGNLSGKHGIFRLLPTGYQKTTNEWVETPIKLNSVTDGSGNPQPYSQSKSFVDHTITWKIGDPNVTVTGVNTYVIEYHVRNTIRFDNADFDELYWNLNGNFWQIETDNYKATIHFPAEITSKNTALVLYSGSFGAKDNSLATSAWKDANTLEVASNRTLQADEGISASVTFPKGIVKYSKTFMEKYSFLVFSLIPLLALLAALALWNRFGRDPKLGKPEMAEYEPPQDLTPLELGTLYSNGYFKNPYISAAIVDLAVKKILKIEEIAKKGLFGKKDYSLTLLDRNAVSKLGQAEQILVNGLFGAGDNVTLSSLQNKFYTTVAKINSGITDSLIDKKLFQKSGFAWQIGFIVITVILGTAAGFSFSVLPVLGAMFVVSALIFLAFSFLMRQRTPEGAEALWQIRGYRLFITMTQKYRGKWEEKENIFEKTLPYAMVFGVVGLWVANMKNIYGEGYFNSYHPYWYYGAFTTFNPNEFAQSMNELSSSMAATLSSSPSSSGSGGGGFSGGGGGGGGGGGW